VFTAKPQSRETCHEFILDLVIDRGHLGALSFAFNNGMVEPHLLVFTDDLKRSIAIIGANHNASTLKHFLHDGEEVHPAGHLRLTHVPLAYVTAVLSGGAI
jgi:hypothetical protein